MGEVGCSIDCAEESCECCCCGLDDDEGSSSNSGSVSKEEEEGTSLWSVEIDGICRLVAVEMEREGGQASALSLSSCSS
jgi:hypothetical protein